MLWQWNMWKHTAHWRDERFKTVGYCSGAVAAKGNLTQAQTQLQGTVLMFQHLFRTDFPAVRCNSEFGRE